MFSEIFIHKIPETKNDPDAVQGVEKQIMQD
jgi:hypothetical protein